MTFRPKPHKAWLASLLLSAGALLGGVVPEAEAEEPLKVGSFMSALWVITVGPMNITVGVLKPRKLSAIKFKQLM